MKTKTSLTILCLFLILLQAGCAEISQVSENSNPITTETPAISSTSSTSTLPPFSSPAPLPTQTRVLRATPTNSLPTLTDEQARQVFLSLEDESCRLPCYLGIVPGQTLLEDATQKLSLMGATLLGTNKYVYQGGELYEYSYYLDIGTPAKGVAQHIRFFVFDEKIFRMGVEILGASSKQLMIEHWMRYSIPSLLEEYGIPDAVDSEVETNVWVLYNDAGFYIGNMGVTREANIVCPGFRIDGAAHAYLLLFDPQAKDLLAASSEFDEISAFDFADGFLQINKQFIPPIEVSLGISPEQFYKQVMADPTVCFERVNP